MFMLFCFWVGNFCLFFWFWGWINCNFSEILFLACGLGGVADWVGRGSWSGCGSGYFLGLGFLEDIARPWCLRSKIFGPIFMNICWFLFGWGLLEDFLFWVLLLFFSYWVSKSSLGILRGVEIPGLLFLLGVGRLAWFTGSCVLTATCGFGFGFS